MTCRDYQSDKHYVRDIRMGGAALERATDCLYRSYRGSVLNMIRSFIRVRSGIEDDAVDALQDAFLIMIEKIRGDGYNEGSLLHFWAGITRGLLKNKLKRDAKTDLIEDHSVFEETVDISPESLLLDQEKKRLLNALLDKLGGRCKKVLLMWAGGYSMTEIAERTGLNSEAMARKTKYQCKNQLMTLLDGLDIDLHISSS